MYASCSVRLRCILPLFRFPRHFPYSSHSLMNSGCPGLILSKWRHFCLPVVSGTCRWLDLSLDQVVTLILMCVGPLLSPSSNTTSLDSRIRPVGRCRHTKALLFPAYPRWTHSSNFTSSLCHFSSGTWTWAVHPKIRKCATDGLFPVKRSYGMAFPCTAHAGTQFSICAA